MHEGAATLPERLFVAVVAVLMCGTCVAVGEADVRERRDRAVVRFIAMKRVENCTD